MDSKEIDKEVVAAAVEAVVAEEEALAVDQMTMEVNAGEAAEASEVVAEAVEAEAAVAETKVTESPEIRELSKKSLTKS